MQIDDTEELIKLLDAAISSDNAAIKQQLQSLLVTVSLVHGGEDSKFGPFRNVLHRVTDLEHKLEQVTDYIQRHIVEKYNRDGYRASTWPDNTWASSKSYRDYRDTDWSMKHSVSDEFIQNILKVHTMNYPSTKDTKK